MILGFVLGGSLIGASIGISTYKGEDKKNDSK